LIEEILRHGHVERLPYIVGAAIGGVFSLAGAIAGALLTAFLAAAAARNEPSHVGAPPQP
jgi:branched-subunit amino acid ABC-type transport system permease component